MKFSFLKEIMLQHKSSFCYIVIFALSLISPATVSASHNRFFNVQSIDTMKYSRDMARDQGASKDFTRIIDAQVKQIADTGATHIAIATPYDEEFVPFLTSWVQAARKYKLKVWFRGNFSGWEQWFNYPRISQEKHTELITSFITNNTILFEDGDVFTSCPECENGGPGDPRKTGDVEGYREFLISEYKATQNAFKSISKNIIANYYSMNGDVAELVMNKDTTAKLGGVVTIDHYVLTPERLNNDINNIAEKSGGKIVLGEFGAPIPDIHGDMTEKDQEAWLKDLLMRISQNKNIIGVNYWTSHGSSTELWSEDNKQKLGVQTLKAYYRPKNIHGIVTDNIGRKLSDVTVTVDGHVFSTDKKGRYNAIFVDTDKPITFSKLGYIYKKIEKSSIQNDVTNITLYPKKPSLLEYILHLFFSILRK